MGLWGRNPTDCLVRLMNRWSREQEKKALRRVTDVVATFEYATSVGDGWGDRLQVGHGRIELCDMLPVQVAGRRGRFRITVEFWPDSDDPK